VTRRLCGGPLIVPLEVLAAIREHARNAPRGFEVCGRIVVVDDLAVRYEPLRNRATEPGRFRLVSSWKPEPDEEGIVVHSHPIGPGLPSRGDVAHARSS